jgi:uncharacterized protein (DUF983 family)
MLKKLYFRNDDVHSFHVDVRSNTHCCDEGAMEKLRRGKLYLIVCIITIIIVVMLMMMMIIINDNLNLITIKLMIMPTLT